MGLRTRRERSASETAVDLVDRPARLTWSALAGGASVPGVSAQDHRVLLGLQRSAGNAATTLAVQRAHVDASTGRKVFDCTRFFGEPKLDACLNDEARLGPPETSSAVVAVQDALLRDGADLGPGGVDGKYGRTTAEAVRTFKAKYDLGFSEFGDVGPGTMDKLDQLCLGRQNPGPTPPPPPVSDDLIVRFAKSERDSALRTAGNELRAFEAALRDGELPVGRWAATATAVTKWLLVPTSDSAFAETVIRARKLVDANALVETTITIDRSRAKDFANVGAIGVPSSGIFIQNPFFGSNVRCQREVMAHEFFHLSGLVHAYGTAVPEEAINCPHHMAELVFDLATKQTEGCSRPPVDDLEPMP